MFLRPVYRKRTQTHTSADTHGVRQVVLFPQIIPSVPCISNAKTVIQSFLRDFMESALFSVVNSISAEFGLFGPPADRVLNRRRS